MKLSLLILSLAVSAQGQNQKERTQCIDSSEVAQSGKLSLRPSTLPLLSFAMPRSEIVFTVADSTRTVTVPRGWERIIVIRGGEVWSIDSSMKCVSHPNNPWRSQ